VNLAETVVKGIRRRMTKKDANRFREKSRELRVLDRFLFLVGMKGADFKVAAMQISSKFFRTLVDSRISRSTTGQ
jgi:hypothetical protein